MLVSAHGCTRVFRVDLDACGGCTFGYGCSAAPGSGSGATASAAGLHRRMIGTADDFSDADGVAILDYRQARARMVQRAHATAGKQGPLTVADAMDGYLAFLD